MIYLIADRARASAVPRALAALPAGVALVQLRDRSAPAGELLRLARALAPICRAHGARLLVNDRADLARAAGADGVHLPADGLAVGEARSLAGDGALVGASCHGLAEVEQRWKEGADFCVFGPVWEVPGKGPALGPGALAAATRRVPIPVLALGGVDARTAALAREAGAGGVACIRSVLEAADPAAAALAVWRAFRG